MYWHVWVQRSLTKMFNQKENNQTPILCVTYRWEQKVTCLPVPFVFTYILQCILDISGNPETLLYNISEGYSSSFLGVLPHRETQINGFSRYSFQRRKWRDSNVLQVSTVLRCRHNFITTRAWMVTTQKTNQKIEHIYHDFKKYIKENWLVLVSCTDKGSNIQLSVSPNKSIRAEPKTSSVFWDVSLYRLIL